MLTTVLTAAHVVAALLLLGPITVAASRFPRLVRAARDAPDDPGPLAAARELHAITRGYAAASVVVPALGVGVTSALQLFGQRWLQVAIALTALAAAVLVLGVLQGQTRVLATLTGPDNDVGLAPLLGRLGAATGVFGLLWVAVAVLMVAQPRLGS